MYGRHRRHILALPLLVSRARILVKSSDILQGDALLTTNEHETFGLLNGLKRLTRKAVREVKGEALSSNNNWGFNDDSNEWPEKHGQATMGEVAEKLTTTIPYYEEVDSSRNGLLKDIGSINVGFGVGVGVPGNDPVRVASRVRFSSFFFGCI
ncbi:hypothetical protein ANCCAN_10021 [Ancylostoma caninum]|uniref:Uncharacterized protein n=1 Tax=Ancylostoma caninum TaxID=29170 RepID=A0A368GHZ6_ANCCA|nr:hypothetical protein ANCCAN_10021 [Ancylostoma caninum]